ncbi:MAG: poly-gamma-glutamate system protein [Bacteroidetes bacterium]|nr:poly-gamma-glutamate system protein [Bacteroidota bacterium]
MLNFRATSKVVLGILTILSLLALLLVENSKVDVKQDWYNEKLEAARLSQKAAEYLKNYRLEKGVFIDVVNDPNETALIGQEYTLITTDQGFIDAKLSATNPNFAAVIVQLLKDAGLKAGDHVAIAFSGSFPGLNISVIAATEILKLKPVMITSVGASNFGANDPYFTWLDMESVLVQSGIFRYKSIAASIGGGNDLGRGLSPEGRDLIEKAIARNNVRYINEKHLEKNIAKRLDIYEEYSKGSPIKAYINVGGGIASLGNAVNGKIIPSGLTEHLPMGNFPIHGTMIQMAIKGIPIIHLLNINQLLAEYDLPASPDPIPEPGEGGIFVQKKYNILITSVSTLVLVIVIVLVYLAERKHHRLGTDVVARSEYQMEKIEKAEDIPVI